MEKIAEKFPVMLAVIQGVLSTFRCTAGFSIFIARHSTERF